jgi:hypothetical protein
MHRLAIILTCFLGVNCALAKSAEAETFSYLCQMGGGRGIGWVANTYSYQFDTDALTVRVDDLITDRFGGAQTVPLDLRGNGNLIFRWELQNVTTSWSGSVRIIYNAFINVKTGQTHVEASFPSFGFVPARRRGMCTGG